MAGKEQGRSAIGVADLLLHARFDELFVGVDRDSFDAFLKEHAVPGRKIAVSFPTEEGLGYISYKVETATAQEDRLDIYFNLRKIRVWLPPERGEDPPEKIFNRPVFHLEDTSIWKQANIRCIHSLEIHRFQNPPNP